MGWETVIGLAIGAAVGTTLANILFYRWKRAREGESLAGSFDVRTFISEFAYSFCAGCCAIIAIWLVISFVSWKPHVFGPPLLFSMARLVVLGSVIYAWIKAVKT